MLGLSATKIFAGIAAGLLITTLAMGWALRHEIQQSAVLRQANKANLDTIERLEADIIINEAKAIADALERREMQEDIRGLEHAATNGGLGAVIDLRRLQRERDRLKAGRP